MAKNKKKFKIFFKQNILLIFGLFFICIFLFWRYHQLRILSFSSNAIDNLQTQIYKFTPIHIKAYPVGVEVDVKPSTIKDGIWSIFPDSVGYIVNGNNLIVYGHNKDDLMGPIRYIKKDAEITIVDQDNNEHKYKVVETNVIEPDNLYYIQSTNEETLTLYTCTGFFDSKRFIVVAKRIN